MPTMTALILLLIGVLIPLEQVTAAGASLRVLWSKPIPAGPQSGALILSERIRNTDGSLAFVATGGLMTAPDESGPGPVTPWRSKNGRVLVIAQGKENTFWLGGLINQRSYVPGGDISDAYLAKIDNQGRLIDEHIYKSWVSFRGIRDLLPLDSGEVVVADNNWLAQVADNGRIVWEKKFQREKNTALSRIGDRIIVAAIEGDLAGGKEKYQDNVVVRVLAVDGKSLATRNIRSGINEEEIGHFGNLQITKSSDDAVYVSSNWVDLFNAKPIEISKISKDGNTIWRKELVHSISQNSNKTWVSCKPALTVLADGDLLVACAIRDEIFIYRLDAKTGGMNVKSTALPHCYESHPASLFLTQRQDGKIWLFGSRPGNNVAASCTWLGELMLK